MLYLAKYFDDQFVIIYVLKYNIYIVKLINNTIKLRINNYKSGSQINFVLL